ncbi:hypothetical protein [Bifidobacterium sp.]|uniref:hypothetical protein n=1 Tax=Bifidobacterium sp. TaxID=41200 RepID=UPI0039E73A20
MRGLKALVDGLAEWRDGEWLQWNIESRLRELYAQLNNAFARDESEIVKLDDIRYLPDPGHPDRGREDEDANRETTDTSLLDLAQKHMFGG